MATTYSMTPETIIRTIAPALAQHGLATRVESGAVILTGEMGDAARITDDGSVVPVSDGRGNLLGRQPREQIKRLLADLCERTRVYNERFRETYGIDHPRNAEPL